MTEHGRLAIPVRRTILMQFMIVTLLFGVASGAAHAQFGFGVQQTSTDFVDPSGNFSVAVPAGWTYQAEFSEPGFALFYGPGDYDLFYIEIVGPGAAELTAVAQAQAALDQYSGPDGLADFRLISAPSAGALGGREASFIVYSYTDSDGITVVEGRAFAIAGGDVYTLAFADASDSFDAKVAVFNTVMESFAITSPQALSNGGAAGAGFGVGAGSPTTTSGGPTAVGGGATAGGSMGGAASGGVPSGASVYESPGRFYRVTLPAGWELWEEQATARGDAVEPWHSLLNWPGKPVTKSLFIWDHFDEWLQTSAQYEIVAAVVENVPGTQADAVEQLTNVAAGASAGTYVGTTERVRLGAEAAFAVKIGVRPGLTELWSEGSPWHREITFYLLKRSTTLFVLAVPDAIVDSDELTAVLQSFVWLGR